MSIFHCRRLGIDFKILLLEEATAFARSNKFQCSLIQKKRPASNPYRSRFIHL